MAKKRVFSLIEIVQDLHIFTMLDQKKNSPQFNTLNDTNIAFFILIRGKLPKRKIDSQEPTIETLGPKLSSLRHIIDYQKPKTCLPESPN